MGVYTRTLTVNLLRKHSVLLYACAGHSLVSVTQCLPHVCLQYSVCS